MGVDASHFDNQPGTSPRSPTQQPEYRVRAKKRRPRFRYPSLELLNRQLSESSTSPEVVDDINPFRFSHNGQMDSPTITARCLVHRQSSEIPEEASSEENVSSVESTSKCIGIPGRLLRQLTIEDEDSDEMFEKAISTSAPGNYGVFSPLLDIQTQCSSLPIASTLLHHKAKYSRRILVKTRAEKHDCLITGIAVLSNENIVVADNNNKSVKLIDLNENKVVSRLKLSSDPWDITTLTDDQVAVTMPSKTCVQILSTKDSDLSKVQTIELNAACYGIGFQHDKLFMLCCGTSAISLVVMTLDGQVLKVIRNDAEGVPLFSTGDHLSVTADAVYVPDRDTNVITHLTHEGKLVATYEDEEINVPSSLATTEDGHLLVCSWTSQDVIMLGKDFHKKGVVLGKEQGMKWPKSMSFCEARRNLYVGSHDIHGEGHENVNYIRVFHFK